jgi:hypothetical protein
LLSHVPQDPEIDMVVLDLKDYPMPLFGQEEKHEIVAQ